MNGSRLRPYLGPLIALLIVLALGAGTVYAAIPNGSGTYYACLTKSSGVVRLINYPNQKCAKRERFIKWSQQGPAGAQGAQGAQGPKGDPGPADWNAIANKPAGFADGVDNVGYSSATKPVTYSIAAGDMAWVSGYTPVGADVELTIIPAPGRQLEVQYEWYSMGPLGGLPAGWLEHWYGVRNPDNTATTFKVRTRVYDTGIAPAALKKAPHKVKVTVTKTRPG